MDTRTESADGLRLSRRLLTSIDFHIVPMLLMFLGVLFANLGWAVVGTALPQGRIFTHAFLDIPQGHGRWIYISANEILVGLSAALAITLRWLVVGLS